MQAVLHIVQALKLFWVGVSGASCQTSTDYSLSVRDIILSGRQLFENEK